MLNKLCKQFYQFQSAEEWKTVFYIAAAIYLFGGVIYWIWVQGTVQPWAIFSEKSTDLPKPADNAQFVYKNETMSIKDE